MSKIVGCALFLAVSLLVARPAQSQPDTIHAGTVGQHGFMDSDWYICSSWEAFKRFYQLMKEGDAEAAFLLGDRDCSKVRDGTEVVVEDTNVLWGPSAVCVRPFGSLNCGWVIPGFVMAALCHAYYGPNHSMTCVPRTAQDNAQRPWRAGYSGK
jgi:hypothetical protein